MPHSRPMPDIGPRCHELRVQDDRVSWRVVYRTDPNAILIVDVFAKATPQTPPHVLEVCRRRLRVYDARKKEDQ